MKHIEEFSKKHESITKESVEELNKIIDILPIAYEKTNAIFKNIEKKNPGEGGIFSIFVSDLCKGCGACVSLWTWCTRNGSRDWRNPCKTLFGSQIFRNASWYNSKIPWVV